MLHNSTYSFEQNILSTNEDNLQMSRWRGSFAWAAQKQVFFLWKVFRIFFQAQMFAFFVSIFAAFFASKSKNSVNDAFQVLRIQHELGIFLQTKSKLMNYSVRLCKLFLPCCNNSCCSGGCKRGSVKLGVAKFYPVLLIFRRKGEKFF